MTKIYYIIDDKDAHLKDIYQRLSGYVEYENYDDAFGILDIRGTESVYRITTSLSDDKEDLVSTLFIKRM